VTGSYEHGNEPSVSIKGVGFVTSCATASFFRTLPHGVRSFVSVQKGMELFLNIVHNYRCIRHFLHNFN
jgi:hypothetical protein